MIEQIRDWAREHISLLVLVVTGLLLAAGLVTLASSALGSNEADPAQVEAAKDQLRTERDDARSSVDTQYATLQQDMRSVDVERVGRDEKAGRSLMLALAGTSASSNGAGWQQASLAERYDALETDGQVLGDFLPEWLSATRSSGPVTYRLSSMDIQVTDVKSLTYTYFGVAHLDPVGAPEGTGSEYVLLRWSTDQEGNVSDVEAYRASAATRDELVAADAADEDEKNQDAAPSDGGR